MIPKPNVVCLNSFRYKTIMPSPAGGGGGSPLLHFSLFLSNQLLANCNMTSVLCLYRGHAVIQHKSQLSKRKKPTELRGPAWNKTTGEVQQHKWAAVRWIVQICHLLAESLSSASAKTWCLCAALLKGLLMPPDSCFPVAIPISSCHNEIIPAAVKGFIRSTTTSLPAILTENQTAFPVSDVCVLQLRDVTDQTIGTLEESCPNLDQDSGNKSCP